MTAPDVVAPAGPTRFVSVKKPELGILEALNEDGSEGDVWICELCDGGGTEHVSFEAAWSGLREDGERPCIAERGGCDGFGYVHGFDDHGWGMPANPVGDG